MYRYDSGGADEHTVHYEIGYMADPYLERFTPREGDVILDLNPKNNWIDEWKLKHIWWDDEMSRSSKRPFQFEGLMYTNNCIFCITRSKGRHKSNTFGEMIVRGAIVGADLGMLIPGKDFSKSRDGLNLYYDKRVANFLRVEDTSQVEITRSTMFIRNDDREEA